MNLELVRLISQADSTVSGLYQLGPRRFLCFVLEDEFREVKVPKETRIPQGRYRITLRRTGGFHIRYAARFAHMHKGMLHLEDVPNFELILVHTGANEGHTAGCLLVGDTAMPRVGRGEIGGSEVAYRRIYPPIAGAILAGQEVWLTVTDFA